MKVTYKDHMGDDLAVVNAARVSFGKKSDWEWIKGDGEVLENSECWIMSQKEDRCTRTLSKADQGLIQFLARGCTSGEWDDLKDRIEYFSDSESFDEGQYYAENEFEKLLNHIRKMPDHWTPFGHTAITLHIKAPIFVARQIHKHQAGFVVNEVSRRYVTDEPEFYVPDTWRKAAENVKQGSSEEGVDWTSCPSNLPAQAMESMVEVYKKLIKEGVCAEQARLVLPQGTYTEFYMTGNLYGWASMYNQRTDSHAQKEVRDVAHQIGEIIEPLFPHSWKCLTK